MVTHNEDFAERTAQGMLLWGAVFTTAVLALGVDTIVTMVESSTGIISLSGAVWATLWSMEISLLSPSVGGLLTLIFLYYHGKSIFDFASIIPLTLFYLTGSLVADVWQGYMYPEDRPTKYNWE
jgi:energy-converting hydrogenase Eha subunit A